MDPRWRRSSHGLKLRADAGAPGEFCGDGWHGMLADRCQYDCGRFREGTSLERYVLPHGEWILTKVAINGLPWTINLNSVGSRTSIISDVKRGSRTCISSGLAGLSMLSDFIVLR